MVTLDSLDTTGWQSTFARHDLANICISALTAGVILAVTRSLWRTSAHEGASPSEIEAYKLQLEELDREEERGTLGKEEARQTRAEVSRRLLRASRQGAAPSAKKGQAFGAIVPAALVAAVIGLGSIGTYIYYGRPGAPDQPLEARLNVPLGEQTPDIQIANMERRLRQNPADSSGWAVIATIYFKAGLFEKAADAFQRSIDAGGEDENKLLGLAESLDFRQ